MTKKKKKKVQHITPAPITEREIREYVRSLIQRGLASRAILGAASERNAGHSSRPSTRSKKTNQTTQQHPLKGNQS